MIKTQILQRVNIKNNNYNFHISQLSKYLSLSYNLIL